MRFQTSFRLLLMLALGASRVLAARADVTLPAIFSDGMVLQRDAVLPIWGNADAGETVTVALGAQKKKAVAGAEGKWMLRLAPLPAGEALQMTVSGKNKIVIRDVSIGEVWLASGQSNMELRLPRVLNAKAEIAAANFPQIRQFRVGRKIAATPQSAMKGFWQAATPQTAQNFTAVGYFFARELHRKLGVPVGIIHASYGGTPAQAWTSETALRSNPNLQQVFDDWQKTLADYPQQKADYDRQLESWKQRADAARTAGKSAPSKPIAPPGPGGKASPSGLYNGMIAPLIPYGIRGIIWYQGESDTRRPKLYRALFPALIQSWRRDWNAELPFLFVQLANFHKPQTQPVEDGWAQLREAQANVLTLPQTGMAVAIDVGEANDIHYANKQEVGRRLALIALAKQYGQHGEYSGPIFAKLTVEGSRLRVHFTHAEGLKIGGADAGNAREIKGFAIAGKDGKFQWAQAEIDGADVVLSSSDVPQPIAARYDWADNPIGNLVNAADLPAAPFRSDALTQHTF